MDADRILPFPLASTESLERELAEVDAAIAMVAAGFARRVRLVGLAWVDTFAAAGLARAQGARVGFRLARSVDGTTAVTLGPLGPED
jgi:hypothetical protein